MRTVVASVLAVMVGATAAGVAAPVVAAGAAGRTPAGPTIVLHGATRDGVGPGFVGLTLEAADLGAAYLDPARSNLPSLLDELGSGNLRIGGQTSDLSVAWLDSPTDPLPSWATSSATPDDLTAVGGIAHDSGWSVDLGVNLLEFDPATAADEVRSATTALGSSLRAVEFGNEPDLYFYFESFLTDPPGGVPTTFPAWLANWNAYAAAVRASSPGVTVNGPDFYLTSWLADVTKKTSAPLADFTQHFYPLEDCGGAVLSPSQLLDPSSFTTEDQLVGKALQAAKAGHHPLVLDEFNSISCGSTSPAAWEFASSLWAVHALLDAAADGVASVNVQMNPGNCSSYTPLCVPDPGSPGTLEPRPIFEGMQLVSGLEGGTFLHSTVKAVDPLPTGVSQYAVRLPDGRVDVVVDNTTSAAVTGLSLNLDAGASLVGTEVLAAPSLTSTIGVTLTSAPASGAPTGLTVAPDTAEVFTLAP